MIRLLSIILLCVCYVLPPSQAQIIDTAVNDSLDKHIPGAGFPLATSKFGTVYFKPYVSFRYLNQKGTDSQYTDAFGHTKKIQRRHDFQMQKVILYLKGWLLDPKFRYVLYTWTSNANMGDEKQIVVAGYAEYEIKKWIDIGTGATLLPCSRSMIYSSHCGYVWTHDLWQSILRI